MNVPKMMVRSVLLALFLSVVSQLSLGAVVRWELTDVEFSVYPIPAIDVLRPNSSDRVTAMGSFTVNTVSRQMTDWDIRIIHGSDEIMSFFPNSCGAVIYPALGKCSAWIEGAYLGSGKQTTDPTPQFPPSTLWNGQSFEFYTSQCGHCIGETVTLVAIGSLESGGVLPLASGALLVDNANPYDLTSFTGFLSHGSLIGMIVPEPSVWNCLGIMVVALIGLRLSPRIGSH